MSSMFQDATLFKNDISKWDVPRVAGMNYMFAGARSFKQTLCGAAWVHSKASQTQIFARSTGTIPRVVCASTSALPDIPKVKLKIVVDAYLKRSSRGDYSDTSHVVIGELDVSKSRT